MSDDTRSQLDRIYGPEAEARLSAMVSGLRVFADVWDGANYLYPEVEN